MLSSTGVHSSNDYRGRDLPKKPTMAIQQEYPHTRPLDSPKTKMDSYKDHSQVAFYKDPNSIRFAKDSSKLVLFSHQ